MNAFVVSSLSTLLLMALLAPEMAFAFTSKTALPNPVEEVGSGLRGGYARNARKLDVTTISRRTKRKGRKMDGRKGMMMREGRRKGVMRHDGRRKGMRRRRGRHPQDHAWRVAENKCVDSDENTQVITALAAIMHDNASVEGGNGTIVSAENYNDGKVNINLLLEKVNLIIEKSSDKKKATKSDVVSILSQKQLPITDFSNKSTDKKKGHPFGICELEVMNFVAVLFGIILTFLGIGGFTFVAEDLAMKFIGVADAVPDMVETIINSASVGTVTKIANVIVAVFRKLTVMTVLDVLGKSIPWYAWLLLVVSVTAQIVAAVFTDGVSLAANVVGALAQVGGFAAATDGIIKYCGSG